MVAVVVRLMGAVIMMRLVIVMKQIVGGMVRMVVVVVVSVVRVVVIVMRMAVTMRVTVRMAMRTVTASTMLKNEYADQIHDQTKHRDDEKSIVLHFGRLHHSFDGLGEDEEGNKQKK